MKTQNNLERITSLLVLFYENQGILTRNQIFQKLNSFYFDSNVPVEKEIQNAKRKFERDKKTLEELGYTLNRIGKSKYQLSDVARNRNVIEQLTDQEEKKLSELLIKKLSEKPDQYLILYLKLFYKNIKYIKKLLKNRLSQNKIENFLSKNDKDVIEIVEKINELFLKRKPLKIFYLKKNQNEFIERDIFPLMIYYNKSISYLISWDYKKNDIRSFLIENIKEVKELNPKDFKMIKIVNYLSNVKEEKNYIFVAYDFILQKLPHSLNIPDSEKPNVYKVILTIKKEYFELYKSFFKQIKKIGSYDSYMVIEVRVKNLTGMFYWISRYEDSLIKIESEEIKNHYKKFLEEIIEFYQKNSYAFSE